MADLDSEYILRCDESLSKEAIDNIKQLWEEFAKTRTPILLVVEEDLEWLEWRNNGRVSS